MVMAFSRPVPESLKECAMIYFQTKLDRIEEKTSPARSTMHLTSLLWFIDTIVTGTQRVMHFYLL